jgi:hypothetical protein
MMARTQVTLDAEHHRRARRRAAELGISLAEYFRGLVARDIAIATPEGDPRDIFDLGDSGGADVARHKDEYVARAVGRAQSRRARTKRRRG